MQISKLMKAALLTGTLMAANAHVVKADTGYTAAFTTSITYMNIGTSSATITLSYYQAGSATPINVSLPALAAGAAASISAASINDLPSGFRGSAVLSSDQPLAATQVQVSTGAGTVVKNRPLSNGIAQGQTSVLIATILKDRFGQTTRFSVQNAHTANVDITVVVKGIDGSSFTKSFTGIPSNSSQHVDVGSDWSEIPSGFSGSATVTAVESGTTTAAPIVATALELGTASAYAAAFEGLSGGSQKAFMPSAMCKYNGQSTFYAVQNTGTAATDVTVTYSNGTIASQAALAPGAKRSFVACDDGLPEGTTGSAVVEAAAGGTIVAIMKVAGNGITAVTPAESTGAAKLALPYVRWTPSSVFPTARQRAYIAIQNVGTSALAAGAVTIKYTSATGAVVATQSLDAMAANQKRSVNFSQTTAGDVNFGFDEATGTYGGGAIVEGPAGSKLVAVVRIVSSDGSGLVGEDYNGIAAEAAATN